MNNFNSHGTLTFVPTKNPDIVDIYLAKKQIGKIDKIKRELILSRNLGHIHRKTNSIGINFELLSNQSIPYHYIRVKLGREELMTTRYYWKEKGIVRHYSGFEPQSFLRLEDFGIENAVIFEKLNPKQPNLFGDDYLPEIDINN